MCQLRIKTFVNIKHSYNICIMTWQYLSPSFAPITINVYLRSPFTRSFRGYYISPISEPLWPVVDNFILFIMYIRKKYIYVYKKKVRWKVDIHKGQIKDRDSETRHVASKSCATRSRNPTRRLDAWIWATRTHSSRHAPLRNSLGNPSCIHLNIFIYLFIFTFKKGHCLGYLNLDL